MSAACTIVASVVRNLINQPRSVPLSASREWFVRRGRETRGPFDSDQLREFARRGKIRPSDNTRRGTDGAWHEAGGIQGLFAPGAASPTPVTGPPMAIPWAVPVASSVQPSAPVSSVRRKKMRRKRTGFWIVLGLAVSVVSAGGAGMVLYERGAFLFDFGGGEASARTALAAELDKWMARQDHKATHVEVFMAILLDYQIQSLSPVKTDLVDVPYEDWDTYHGPTAVHKELPPTYLATVRVNVESKTGTALPRVILYRLTRDPKAHKWRIRDTMNGK